MCTRKMVTGYCSVCVCVCVFVCMNKRSAFVCLSVTCFSQCMYISNAHIHIPLFFGFSTNSRRNHVTHEPIKTITTTTLVCVCECVCVCEGT